MRGWSMALAAAAGLYGAAGVALLALGAHRAGPLAATAGSILLFHAAAILTLCALDGGRGVRFAATLIAMGALMFAGALTLHALADIQVPISAPAGGMLMIVGWLVAAGAAPLAISRR